MPIAMVTTNTLKFRISAVGDEFGGAELGSSSSGARVVSGRS